MSWIKGQERGKKTEWEVHVRSDLWERRIERRHFSEEDLISWEGNSDIQAASPGIQLQEFISVWNFKNIFKNPRFKEIVKMNAEIRFGGWGEEELKLFHTSASQRGRGWSWGVMLSWVCSITLPTASTLTGLHSQTLLAQHMCWGRVEGKLGRLGAQEQCGSHRDRFSSCHVAARGHTAMGPGSEGSAWKSLTWSKSPGRAWLGRNSCSPTLPQEGFALHRVLCTAQRGWRQRKTVLLCSHLNRDWFVFQSGFFSLEL